MIVTGAVTLPAALLLGLAASGHCMVMCGGIGGTSGSTIASSRTGRSAASASSQASAIRSSSLQTIPLKPSISAHWANGAYGMACEPANFGSPPSARCSHVT